MTSFQQQQQKAKHTPEPPGRGVSYEIINNFCVSEPQPIDLKSKLKRNYTVVCYLAILAIVSFGTVFTFSSLMKRFDKNHCFLETKFKFTHHLPGEEVVIPDEGTAEPFNRTDHLFPGLQIDRQETLWSEHGKCDPVTYPPVVMGMSAIIWATMFYVCSMTDRNHKSLIPNPWRIVLPAFLYFTMMALLAIYYSWRTHNLIDNACENLSEAFDRNGTIPECPELFQHFTDHKGYVKASVLYYAFISCMFSTLVLWIFVSALMLCRCLFGFDFQRTEVEIKPLAATDLEPSPVAQHKGFVA